MISKVCRCRNQFLLSGHQVVETRAARLLVHHTELSSLHIVATSYTHIKVSLAVSCMWMLLFGL